MTTMRRALRFSALAAMLCFFAATSLRAQTALGSIEGVIVDADNNPVPGASVYLVTGPSGTGRGSTVLTNADGRFRLEQLVPGVYTLSIYKTQDGWADGAIAFYADPDHPLPSVTVNTGTETTNHSFQLGARCGILHLNASDAVAHHSISSATVILHQRNNSSAVLQATNKELPADFLVPPQDVTITMDAPGYVTWRFAEDDRNYVTLRPGEQRTVHADMSPTPAK